MYALLKPEHRLVRQLAREFAENEVRPLAAELDEEERFPEETVPKLFKYGFFGAAYPESEGGEGGDNMAYVIALEEISKVCATTGVVYSVQAGLGMGLFAKYGTPEQKEKYQKGAFKDKLVCFALTEPGVGTDASNVQTVAVKDGDDYILNGTKMFITTAGHAEWYIIIAVTDRSKGNNGMTAFIVHKDAPGFSVGKHERKMGIRGSATCELILKNVRVSKEDILGKEGQGLKMALASLDSGRMGIATQALGIAQGAIDETIKYVKERKQFGKRISQFQNTQFKLAELQTKVDAGRMLVWRCAMLKDAGLPFGKEAAMAKLYNSDVANLVTRECVQLSGGYGYTREYPMERMMRDAKITEIYEGTSEAQKMVISRAIGVK